MLSGWLKNLMASVYRAKSLVCCVGDRERAGEKSATVSHSTARGEREEVIQLLPLPLYSSKKDKEPQPLTELALY